MSVTAGSQLRNPRSASGGLKVCLGPTQRVGLPTSEIAALHPPKNSVRYAAVLVAFISLSLTGCKLAAEKDATQEKSASPAGTIVPPSVTPAPAPASPPQPPSRPAPPGQPTQLAEAKRPPAATSTKGAEKLMAPIAPALTRTEETVSHPAAVRPESAPPVQKPAAVPSQPIKELIVKGPSRVEPPRVVRTERASSTTGLWIGLGCVALAACIAAPILLKRQRKPSGPSKSGREELVTLDEFLLKEPEPLPSQTITFDRMYRAKETSKQQIL